ncbi:hypothetical protein BJG93_36540 (plasmid) [Paraburkholderia sprentiae WSM5005]|uniref:Uncharacterized protein n=1 Tax=Paraburkholderia sprentiae WSM5005 TaxID=754502 RepID=A0A8F4KI67_9BURK|nr:hypothetical protein [Paraburkholderia sprentiae]QXE07334.1 hypothetical protein BJG93_36540 [Paraburkholderia sprentiae WSM5005]
MIELALAEDVVFDLFRAQRDAWPCGVGFINPIQEACPMRHVPSLPEQTQSSISFPIIGTLLAAALAFIQAHNNATGQCHA